MTGTPVVEFQTLTTRQEETEVCWPCLNRKTKVAATVKSSLLKPGGVHQVSGVAADFCLTPP